jgi:hypothetical protein
VPTHAALSRFHEDAMKMCLRWPVLVVLLASGSSLRTALPFAALLACPLMMGGMMFMMMRGNRNQQGSNASTQRDHDEASSQGSNEALETWQDSPNLTPPPSTTRP